mgnify:CR=1 FL=1
MKYRFSIQLLQELTAFQDSLKEEGYKPSTARQHSNYAGMFLSWLGGEGIQEDQARYQEVIAFVQELKQQDHSPRFINRVLLGIRQYYRYLDYPHNPALGVHLKGSHRKLRQELVKYKELQWLYQNYPAEDNRGKRNRVMLGLMIYQGLTVWELEKLQLKHINLKEVKIRVPGSKHSNPRTLEIKAVQLLDLNEYLQEVRLRMLKEIEKERSGRKPQKVDRALLEDQLFFSEQGSEKIKSSLLHLFRGVKKLNPMISSAKVIRRVVITHWLEGKDVREVQYMAGHRYVSSTERYQSYRIEEFAELLKKYHPLG